MKHAIVLLGGLLGGLLPACSDSTKQPERLFGVASLYVNLGMASSSVVLYERVFEMPGERRRLTIAAPGQQPAVRYTSPYLGILYSSTLGAPAARQDDFAIDQDAVYVIDYCANGSTTDDEVARNCRALLRIPLAGGAPTTLATGWIHSFGLLGDMVWYVGEEGTGHLDRVAKTGGAPTRVVEDVRAVFAREGQLISEHRDASQSCFYVRRNAQGEEFARSSSHGCSWSGIATATSLIFDSQNTSRLISWDFADTATVRILSEAQPRAFTLRGTTLFVLPFGEAYQVQMGSTTQTRWKPSSLMQIDSANETSVRTIFDQLDEPRAVTADDAYLYWVARDGDGQALFRGARPTE